MSLRANTNSLSVVPATSTVPSPTSTVTLQAWDRMVSSALFELFFPCEILKDATIETILSSPQRSNTVLYDEWLDFYLVVRLPLDVIVPGGGTLTQAQCDKVLRSFLRGFDVLVDSVNVNNVPEQEENVSLLYRGSIMPLEPNSQVDDVIFRSVNDERLVQVSIEQRIALYPLRVFVKPQSSTVDNAQLSMIVVVTKKSGAQAAGAAATDVNAADADLRYTWGSESLKELLNLDEDSHLQFTMQRPKNFQLPSVPFRRALTKTFAVQPSVHVHVHAIMMESDLALFSLELANPGKDSKPLCIESLELLVVSMQAGQINASTRTKSLSDECFKQTLPMVLEPDERHRFLFNVSLVPEFLPVDFFDPVKSNYGLLVRVQATQNSKASEKHFVRSQSVSPTRSLAINRTHSVVSTFTLPISVQNLFQERKLDDLSISFHVANTGNIRVRQLFTVQVFVVNRTKTARELSLIVPAVSSYPNARLLDSKLSLEDLSAAANQKLFMDDKTFLTLFRASERRDSGLVCLENDIYLGHVAPGACAAASLHFVAVKPSMHAIEWLQLLDHGTQITVDFRRTLELFVHD